MISLLICLSMVRAPLNSHKPQSFESRVKVVGQQLTPTSRVSEVSSALGKDVQAGTFQHLSLELAEYGLRFSGALSGLASFSRQSNGKAGNFQNIFIFAPKTGGWPKDEEMRLERALGKPLLRHPGSDADGLGNNWVKWKVNRVYLYWRVGGESGTLIQISARGF